MEENENKFYNSKKSKKKGKRIAIIVLSSVAALSLAGSIVWASRSGLSVLHDELTTSAKEKIELTYTKSSTVASEGVYITDVSEVVDNTMSSIVAITSKTVISSGRFGPIYSDNDSYTTEGAGSGVIVATDDDEIFILTNYHVVENTTELSVTFIDDESYDATIKGTSERKDIAIVSVKKSSVSESTLKSIKIATIGSSDDLKVGNGIIAIGNALGYGQSVTTGVVSALDREVATDESSQKMIQIDAAINGGNSGGALLNSKGEVVGINTAKYSSNGSSTSASIEGMGFAIPISDVKSIIEDLINGKNDTSNILLGIEGYMTNSSNMIGYGLPDGFYVSAITEGSNADKSELAIGNIITAIDGTKVSSASTIKKYLSNKEVGDTVTLTVSYVSRNQYKEKEIKIKLS